MKNTLIILTLIAVFACITLIVNHNSSRLDEEGIVATGYVENMKLENNGYKIYFTVHFYVNGKEFVIRRYTTKIDENLRHCLKKGDFTKTECYWYEVKVKYLEDDPDVSEIIWSSVE